MNRGNQEITVGMLFENDIRGWNVKLYFIMLKVQLNTIRHMLEQKRNVNAFNSYHVICELCGDYHATHTCRQVQNVDYYDELGHYNPCFDQNGSNWGNSCAYGWGNQGNYSAYSCLYDYESEFVQYASEPSWELAIERLTNASLPWKLESEVLANNNTLSWDLAIEKYSNQFDLTIEKQANAT